MQDENEEFEDQQKERLNYAEFFSLVAAWRESYPGYSAVKLKLLKCDIMSYCHACCFNERCFCVIVIVVWKK